MSDLINRQDVLDVLRNLAFDHIFQCGEYYGEDERQLTIINARKAIDVIEAMPSAELEQKKGKWIEVDFRDGEMYGFHKCSECWARYYCTFDTPPDWNYCPNCGAEMRGDHEYV